MKTIPTQRKKKIYRRHLLIEKSLFCIIENVIHDQEAQPSTNAHSTFKGDSRDTSMKDSNPISDGELTSESTSYVQMCDAIKESSGLFFDKDFLENCSTISIQSE